MPETPAPIQAVLWDADGVLQSRPGEPLPDALARMAPDPSDAPAFLDDIFHSEQPCLRSPMPFEPVLASVLERWDCRVPLTEVLSVWKVLEVDREILEVIAGVRASGVEAGLATNQWAGRARFMTAHFEYDEHFDHLFFSCHVGAAKPELEFFRRVVAALDLPPESVHFVDDHPRNVEGAVRAGLRAEGFASNGGAPEMRRILSGYRSPAGPLLGH